jgi:hypothetical protein
MPVLNGQQLVLERFVDFEWSPGFSESQKKKNVAALHTAAKRFGISSILEISSKSDERVGQRLSAFSLKIEVDGSSYYLESVYQGAKVFETGGPHHSIFSFNPRDAKKYVRGLDAGRLIGFELEGRRYPLIPKNAFYDWLYIRSLEKHVEWISNNISYEAYTDIEFNPEKQVNCQARAFSEYKSLVARSELQMAVADFSFFASKLSPI